MSRLRLVLTAAAVLTVAPVALAAGGHPQLQTFFQSNLSSASYQQKVYQRVAKKWQQPGPKQTPKVGSKTIVQAVIGKDGKLVTVAVTSESGSKGWDAAALSAVKKAAPFEPLPASYTSPTLEVHFHVGWVAD